MDIDTNGRGIAQIDEDSDVVRGPCPKCGALVDSFPAYLGLGSIEVDGNEANHTPTLCSLRTTLARLTAELAALKGEHRWLPRLKQQTSRELFRRLAEAAGSPPTTVLALAEARMSGPPASVAVARRMERDCHVLRLRAENAEAALLAAELRAKYAERLNDDYATKAVGGLMARGEATERAELAERELAEARGKHALSAGEALTLMRERDASDGARREWEVRAATSYADGRKAGLREAAEMLDAERPGHSKGVLNVLGAMAARMRTCALAPPAAETVKGGA